MAYTDKLVPSPEPTQRHHHGLGYADGIPSGDDLLSGDTGTFLIADDAIVSTATATVPGGSGTGATGATQAVTPPSGLKIIADYDSSITVLDTSNPTLYNDIVGAISTAVSAIESVISTSITITLDFGYGEIAGQAMASGSLGESEAFYRTGSYSSLRAALISHGDNAAYLPGRESGTWYVTSAEAKALGLTAGNTTELDGYVGLGSGFSVNYGTTGQAVSGEYPAVGILEHEITEDMGRADSLGSIIGTNAYTPLDLFHYSAPGVQDLTPGSSYFSIDGGTTNLDNFNNSLNGGDAGDWASSAGDDSFDAFTEAGTSAPLTSADLTEMAALGYTLACFAEGTRILTPRGEVAVEALRIGDIVSAAQAGPVAVKWVGHRSIDIRRHPHPRHVRPIRIRSGAFGPNRPKRDLFLSPDHAVAAGGLLVPIRLLVNGATIVRDTVRRRMRYYHVELDRHDLLWAEGLATESFLDTGNRGVFDNAGQPLQLHPRFADPNLAGLREAESCLPLASDPATIKPLWKALANRAAALGHIQRKVFTTDDPGLCLVTGSAHLAPAFRDGGRYCFVIPAGARRLRLRSRSAVPSDLRPWLEERRSLGVMIQRLTLSVGGCHETIALDDPRLRSGWWAPERDDATIWRWTDGDAELPHVEGPAMLEIQVGETLPYPLADAGPGGRKSGGLLLELPGDRQSQRVVGY